MRRRLLGALLILVLVPGPAAAQVYGGVDDRGLTHFVDDVNDVPERYRSRLHLGWVLWAHDASLSAPQYGVWSYVASIDTRGNCEERKVDAVKQLHTATTQAQLKPAPGVAPGRVRRTTHGVTVRSGMSVRVTEYHCKPNGADPRRSPSDVVRDSRAPYARPPAKLNE